MLSSAAVDEDATALNAAGSVPALPDGELAVRRQINATAAALHRLWYTRRLGRGDDPLWTAQVEACEETLDELWDAVRRACAWARAEGRGGFPCARGRPRGRQSC